jgi:hypothetical protein
VSSAFAFGYGVTSPLFLQLRLFQRRGAIIFSSAILAALA